MKVKEKVGEKTEDEGESLRRGGIQFCEKDGESYHA